MTEGAVTGAVSHGVGKYIKKAKSSLSNEELVQKAATLAERKIGGTGKVAGTQKHAYAKKLIDSGKSKDVIHYRAGQIIPEPWASWYRGY